MTFPLATYRLQFHSKFGFKKAEEVLDYLKELGASDIYASPIFRACSGSTHGYDMVDPLQVNPELGGEEELVRLASRAQKNGLGWLQDIVPNHMAFHPENQMLMSVFEKGRSSPYFSYFDIDWDHSYPGLKGRVLAPFLGEFYGEALEHGKLKLSYEKGLLRVNYYDLFFPLKVESLAQIFKKNLRYLKSSIGERSRDLNEFVEMTKSMDSAEKKDRVKQKLWKLYKESQAVRSHMEKNLAEYNKAGSPVSFQLLDKLLSQQLFRLSFWKVAMEEINYRRFFNINDLISVSMEKPEVFDHFHTFLLEALEKGYFTGLRIDHVDGLYDPEAYLSRLRHKVGPCYLVVEKILGPEEKLPESFPVQGTTGYEWMNKVNQLFCNEGSRERFTRIYSRFSGEKEPYPKLTADKKRLIIGKSMAGDIDNLARLVKKASDEHPEGRDFTMYGLRRALVEVMAHFPVYRTYVKPGRIREEDRESVEKAAERACHHIPALAHECSFIKKCLLLKIDNDFALRFQQFTGPVTAKGFEDTFLYGYNRLISLNEVGGNPGRFGLSLKEFHQWNKTRQQEHPFSLNASATHDTKRGEDVRARINVLSEMPGEWERKIKKWSRLNRPYKSSVKGDLAPDANDEYFLYQTLVGTYPFETGDLSVYHKRITEYLIKAVREAKVHTAWIEPDHEYEQAYVDFFNKVMLPEGGFIRDFLLFQQRAAFFGVFNSLAQVLLKITLPGVPDFYQGCELWDLSLVDPDNRRPVDFIRRQKILKEIIEDQNRPRFIKELWEDRQSGRIKMFVTWKALQVRRDKREVFEKGDYVRLSIKGRKKGHIIGFARRYQNNWAVTVVPRFTSGLIEEHQELSQADWQDTRVLLPSDAPRQWDEVLTGEELSFEPEMEMAASELFKSCPVVLLTNNKEEVS